MRASSSTTSALSWVRLPGAESCIIASDLGARVEEHLGRKVLVSPSAADVSIEGRVEVTGQGAARRFRATVGGTRRTGEAIGTREITSPGSDCRGLDDGLVLVVALMIDPDAMEPAKREPPPALPAPITREIVSEKIIVREIERVPSEPPASQAWHVDASASAVAAIERAPGVAPGARLALRAGPSRLVAFELSFGTVPSAALDAGARTVAYTILEGGLAFCPGVALGARVEVGGCAGLRLGDVRSRGQGFGTDHDVDRGLADVAAGGRLAVGITGPLFAVATANAVVPLVRQVTTATNAAGDEVVLHERSALGAELGAGLGLRFSP